MFPTEFYSRGNYWNDDLNNDGEHRWGGRYMVTLPEQRAYADLIVDHANILTLDPAKPRAETMAIRDGRIVYIGDDIGSFEFRGPMTEQFHAGWNTIVPGFCDAHLHLAAFGRNLLYQADLAGVDCVDALITTLRTHAEQIDRLWIEGRGFDQEKMAGRVWPTRSDLDRVSSTRPVVITRVCGHAIVVNSAAIALVTEADRADGDSESGVFTESAIAPFRALIPALSEIEMEQAILGACKVALANGVTSVGTLLDEPVDGAQMGGFRRLRARDALPIRVTTMPPERKVESLAANGIATGFGDDFLRIGGAKFFSDGSLGARTALLSVPYADDDSENLGVRIYDPHDLKIRARAAHDAGFQIVIHAIGDQAVRESIDAIEYALASPSHGPADNRVRRHRIEHASILSPDQLRRMDDLYIVAVVQPQFVISDSWTSERVGMGRATWVYPFRRMVDAGIPLALSSDCPVERLDSFACLSAAVNRAPWSPDGGLEPEEALRAYCLGGAYSIHAEDKLGSLEVGKLADFVVLSEDPTVVDRSRIGSLKVQEVFVGGHVAYSAAAQLR